MSEIPEGATHRNAGFYYRKTGPTWMLFGSDGWIGTACDWAWLDRNAVPLHAVDKRDLAIKDLMRLDGIYHAEAASIYDAGYRKTDVK